MRQAIENGEGVQQDLPGEAALYRLAELATELGAEHIASNARCIAERVSEGQFYVACIGQFKRGKSTLLNALIGYRVLPAGVVPVTAVPTIIRHGERLAARVRFQGARWTPIPVSGVEEYVSEGKNPENAKRVAGVEIFVPSPLLETGMCLVDTPGLGSIFAGNTAATHAFIPHIDAAIVVIGADPPLSGDELKLVEVVSSVVHDLVFVLNKADRASEAERSAALNFAHRVLETRLRQASITIFEVSALHRLEHRAPEWDWAPLVRALDELVLHSGRALVRKATNRGIRHTANQLLGVIREERNALERPLDDSMRRIARLRKTLADSEAATWDLAVLLRAEQQHLSGVFEKRRSVFLGQAQGSAHTELIERLSSLDHSRNGPAYRRHVNHLAQQIARAQLKPWLEREAKFGEDEFRKTAKRFIELANEFLHRLEETDVPGLESLPEEVASEQGLSVRSQFYFHVIERVAAPASPVLFIADLLRGALGLRGGIVRDAQEFLSQLLEVNSSRVQSDVDERVREGRKTLEAKIKQVLREASAIADRALARAGAEQTVGARAIEAALSRLQALEREVLDLSTHVATI